MAPVSKNIRIFWLNNGRGKRHPPFSSICPLPQIVATTLIIRNKAVEIVRRFFKDMVEVSNSNIVRNANNLLTTLLPGSDKNIAWIGTMEQRVGSGKFKLNY